MFIVLTCNIVTGIMLGFVTLVVGRVFAREWQKLNIGTVIITAALVAFLRGWLGNLIDSPRLSAREISSQRILTAGNNTLLADSPEFSFSQQLQRLCRARFNAGWPLFPLFTEIAFHDLLPGIPRQ